MFEVFGGFGSGTELERGISQRNGSLLMIFASFQNIQSDTVMHGLVLEFTHLHNAWRHMLVCSVAGLQLTIIYRLICQLFLHLLISCLVFIVPKSNHI